MTRRWFLRLGALATAVTAFSRDVLAQARPTAAPLTIAQLLVVSFPEVRQSRLDHERKDAPDLWALRESGQLMTRNLGAQVCEILDKGDGTLIERYHDIVVVSTPIAWACEDDTLNPTERQKVNFVSGLLRNAFDVHADQLVQLIATHRAVVSREYTFQSGAVTLAPDRRGYAMCIYTAISVLDPATAYFERPVRV